MNRHWTPVSPLTAESLPGSAIESRLVIGPNASLSERQAWGFMAGVGAVSLGIAGTFAALGYWPVLPFAGLEVAAVGAALFVAMRRNRYREVVSFTQQIVRVEVGILGQGAHAMTELPRAWTRVALEPGGHRGDPAHLVLSCSGQRVEIGRCLGDEERQQVAARIRELLKPAWQTVPGATGAKAHVHESTLGD